MRPSLQARSSRQTFLECDSATGVLEKTGMLPSLQCKVTLAMFSNVFVGGVAP